MTVLARHDPGAVIAHRAVRVTIAMPAVFAFGQLVLDDANVALFGSFGTFALLAFADFGGRTTSRTRAYVVLILVGAVLIALGTAVSQNVVAGGVVLAAVAFTVALSAVYGGYVAAGGQAALLVFVIAVMVPAPVDDLVSREVGWILAGIVSIAIASIVWPVHEQAVLRRAAAAILDELATDVSRAGRPPEIGAIAETGAIAEVEVEDPGHGDVAELRARVTDLRDTFGRMPLRPSGPTQRDQAMMRLLDAIQRSVSVATRMATGEATSASRSTEADATLADAVAASFRHSALVLSRRDPVDVGPDLSEARDEHRTEVARWVADQLRSGSSLDQLVGQLSRTFALRVLAIAAEACETDAALAMGSTRSERGPDDGPRGLLDTPVGGAGVSATLARSLDLVRPHLRPSSVAFRNALRSSLALSAALVVAKEIQAEHGFWVVLGTLTVLRSSATRTGITAVQALLGNVIGFAVAAAVLAASGDRTAALWLILPITVFLAAYMPAAVHFVIGQASFALMVVVLFNLIDPEGWRTGLVRVESVAIGAAVSLVIGAVLWPRGNRRALREAVADLYRHAGMYLDDAFAMARSEDPSVARAAGRSRTGADAAELRADAALFDLLASPATSAVPEAAWARLTSVGRALRLVGDGLCLLPAQGFAPPLESSARAALERAADERVGRVAGLAESIATGSVPSGSSGLDGPTRLGGLHPPDPDDEADVNRALTTLWTLEWLQLVDILVEVDAESIDAVRASVATPWWR